MLDILKFDSHSIVMMSIARLFQKRLSGAIVLALLLLAVAPQSRCPNRISSVWLVSSLSSSEACDLSSSEPFGQGGRFLLLPCRLDAERMDCSQTATLRYKRKGAERHVQGRRKSRQHPPNRNFEVSKVCKCGVSVSEVCRRQSTPHLESLLRSSFVTLR